MKNSTNTNGANIKNIPAMLLRYFDKETSTIYLRARYYSPSIGRFINEDSYWGRDTDPLSLNLYTYCWNDPMSFIDPSGHDVGGADRRNSHNNDPVTNDPWDRVLKFYLLWKDSTNAIERFGMENTGLKFSDKFIMKLWRMQQVEFVYLGDLSIQQMDALYWDEFADWEGIDSKAAYFIPIEGVAYLRTSTRIGELSSIISRVRGNGGVLDKANFAQKTYNAGRFSAEGIAYFSKIAGRSIVSVDDLANALRNGIIKPSQVPIDYITRGSNTLILNTRSSQALIQAGVPRNLWNAVNRSGQANYERMLSDQLTRNKLPPSGTATVRPSKPQ